MCIAARLASLPNSCPVCNWNCVPPHLACAPQVLFPDKPQHQPLVEEAGHHQPDRAVCFQVGLLHPMFSWSALCSHGLLATHSS